MSPTVTIPLERWAALMEERADLLAFKLEVLVGLAPPRRTGDALENLDSLDALRDRVGAAIASSGLSRRAFGRKFGIPAPDLSSFFALFDREKRSERKPSRKSVERLMALFPAPREAHS